ncbi:MAG: hypothetical protein L6276_05075 [Acetobacterium sp.]|nr:hypothetical protein [Acetobacterium sp.]
MSNKTIKTIKANITDLQARIWRNTQFLEHAQKQLALIYRATSATNRRSRAQIGQLRAAIDRDSRQLEAANQALVAAIDNQASPQIQELLTRRYINDQPFADIADAMGYDLRWVYRLHARGLGAEKKAGLKLTR